MNKRRGLFIGAAALLGMAGILSLVSFKRGGVQEVKRQEGGIYQKVKEEPASGVPTDDASRDGNRTGAVMKYETENVKVEFRKAETNDADSAGAPADNSGIRVPPRGEGRGF